VIADIYAASAFTGAKPATIRLWIHRGELAHGGYDKRGRAQVDLEEAKALVERKARMAA
jgi:hypothetical protein